jgi:hypothetical protein
VNPFAQSAGCQNFFPAISALLKGEGSPSFMVTLPAEATTSFLRRLGQDNFPGPLQLLEGL